MLSNKLKLNDDKTEFLIIGSKNNLSHLTNKNLTIGNTEIIATDSVRNLGVIFDKTLGLDQHINNVRKRGFYHVRNLSLASKFLDMEDRNKIAHAFVTSILDYSNSLLYGLPANKIKKLQLV